MKTLYSLFLGLLLLALSSVTALSGVRKEPREFRFPEIRFKEKRNVVLDLLPKLAKEKLVRFEDKLIAHKTLKKARVRKYEIPAEKK